MKLTKLATAAALAAVSAGAFLGTSAAGADPMHAGEVLELSCDELGSVEVATNGNGNWTPALSTSDNRVLVPYRFHFVFDPNVGETEVFDADKPAPRNAQLDRCTFTEVDSDGTFTGTAWVAVRGA